MMARTLAGLGDKTSHEEIISATATGFKGNKAIAQTSDKAPCRECDGYLELLASLRAAAKKDRLMLLQRQLLDNLPII
ncbi:hypothetical protein ACQKDS_15585 [Serratia sp. NPDC078593]|uniref:hypothetical protein n=1 Tax=unclassified Serratia (in: enterobacteria) TaxID=2647522 RepID=UPI0037D435B8